VSSIPGAEKEIFLFAAVLTIEVAAPPRNFKAGDFVVREIG